MATDSFLWTRHVVECRRGCRANRPGDHCIVGKALYARLALFGWCEMTDIQWNRPPEMDGILCGLTMVALGLAILALVKYLLT